MKKIIVFAIIVSIFFISGCSENKRIDGELYETYGLFNKKDVRDEKIEYQLVTGNLVWGIFLAGSIVAPIYFFGFDLYEPVGVR